MVLVELADYNYYNKKQKIIRIKVKTSNNVIYYDIKYDGTEVPHPSRHYVMLELEEKDIILNNKMIMTGDEKLNYQPGYDKDLTFSTNIVYTPVYLVHKQIQNVTTNGNVPHVSNFNSSSDNTENIYNVFHSITPGVDMDYTTNVQEEKEDPNYSGIGIFVTKNSIYLKSEGGGIELGPDGISFYGEKCETHTVTTNGVFKENPFSKILPETLLSFPIAGKYVPNMDFVAACGNNVRRLNKYVKAVSGTTTVLSNLRNLEK